MLIKPDGVLLNSAGIKAVDSEGLPLRPENIHIPEEGLNVWGVDRRIEIVPDAVE